MNTVSILVIDDDPTIRQLLSMCLKAQDYTIHGVKNGREVMQYLEHAIPDLLILDLGLPVMDGFDVCTWIRQRGIDVPIMVLSAYTDVAYVARALDAGADDYVMKPFKTAEFAARLRALLRRSEGRESLPIANKVICEGITIDPSGRQVFIDGVNMHFTRTEIEILSVLAEHPDSVLTNNQLLAKVWGAEYRGSSHYLHVYLGRIRKKMGDKYGRLLETSFGLGYILHSSFRN
ncbi:MAG: response regulator transcription factor [Aggregatilineales bacterium]